MQRHAVARHQKGGVHATQLAVSTHERFRPQPPSQH
jgi:hypothetical protein